MNKNFFLPLKELLEPIEKALYPSHICKDCAKSLNHCMQSMIASFYMGKCGWCNVQKEVTQPRDYGYPPHNKEKK